MLYNYRSISAMLCKREQSELALARVLPGDRDKLACDGIAASLHWRRQHEARDRVAIGKQRFNQGFEVGHVYGRDLEEEVVASRQVMTFADLFECLNIFQQAAIVLSSATHANECHDFEAKGLAINFDSISMDDANLLHLLEPFGRRGRR